MSHRQSEINTSYTQSPLQQIHQELAAIPSLNLMAELSQEISELINTSLTPLHPEIDALKLELYHLSLENLEVLDAPKQFKNIYAHIHLDKFLENQSELNGLVPGTSQIALLCFLKIFLKKEDISLPFREKLNKIYSALLFSFYQAQLNRKLAIQYNMQTLATFSPEDLSSYGKSYIKRYTHNVPITTTFVADEISRYISNLEIGQLYLFPGGYTNPYESHAILYEVCRLSQNSYRFTVYNTGNGIDPYHTSNIYNQSIDPKKLSTAIYYDNIPYEKITASQFWEILLAIRTTLKDDNSPQKIYTTLEQKFGMKAQLSAVKTTPQRSGTCSWKCLNSFLHHQLNAVEYRTLKYLMSCYSICDYVATYFIPLDQIRPPEDKKGKSFRKKCSDLTTSLFNIHASIPSLATISMKEGSFVNDHLAQSQNLYLLSYGIAKLYERHRKLQTEIQRAYPDLDEVQPHSFKWNTMFGNTFLRIRRPSSPKKTTLSRNKLNSS